MGLKPRLKPAKLPEKLKQIRLNLSLSQNEMLAALGYQDSFDRSTIAHYESGDREPPLPILLAYARTAGVSTDALIDDNIDII